MTQLSYQEHAKIYNGICLRLSKRAIAQSIGRARSTIYRELARNSDKIGYLAPKEAFDRQKEKKKKRSTRIDRDPRLNAYIIKHLKKKWSPKVIAGRWNNDNDVIKISDESIYTWLYKKGNEEFRVLLPRAKTKRGFVRRRQKKSKIPDRVSIDQRPEEINNRTSIGHLEADLVFHKGSMSSNVLTVQDRKTRYVFLKKNYSKRSTEVIDGLKALIKGLPITSITFDNGSEFVRHKHLEVNTYFCDPGKPWQKGGIENFNGQYRRHIDFTVHPDSISQSMLDSIALSINHTPREYLNFLTPCEALNQKFLAENNRCCVFNLT